MASDDPVAQTTDVVSAAVRAAALAATPRSAAAGDQPSGTELRRAAAMVEAFLRELPNLSVHLPGPRPLYSLHMLADEVSDAR